MKKTFKGVGIFITILSLTFVLIKCGNKDDGVKYSKLSGKVTLADGTIADGAIVSLSKEPNAADIVGKTVAGADGIYSFMAVENGTYYLSATYEPSNNNNTLKAAGTVILTGQEVEVNVDGDKTADLAMTGAVSDGTGTLNLADGWVYDNTHSTYEFEFPFDAVDAVFTGHFARAGVDAFEFDEQHPENTVIKIWVDVTSVETGAPSLPGGHGRDGITGCIASTFKVQKDAADTVDAYAPDGTLVTNWPNETLADYTGDIWGDGSATTYQKQHAVVGSSGVATFKATEVSPYGTGYVMKGDFSFAGVTKQETVYFTYIDGYTNTDATKTYASFYGFFKIAASADFGISSGHVGDNDVTIKVSLQFNKAL